MGEILIKNKGYKEILLTRYYNSLSTFDLNTDNVMFTEGSNDFSNYLFQVTCGTWQNDKIKILSLPNKGRLYYLTNPGGGAPIYANVFVGQMIVVRDMIDNKVLRFNGEGSSDNQFSDNYLSSFNIERFCGNLSNNILANIKLNMIDLKINIAPRYFINIPQTCLNNGSSPTNYDVYCQGSIDFIFSALLDTTVGFVRMTVDAGTSELGLSKIGSGALVLYEVMPVSQGITATLLAAGINSPAAYPFGYPSQPVPVNYVFQYSLDGVNSWINFNLVVQSA